MVTIEELILLIVSIVGLGAAVFGIYDAWHDIRLLNLKNGRRIVARANLRGQVVRTIKLALFTAIAIVSFSYDSPMPNLARTFVVWGLVVIAMLTAADAVLDRVARRNILNRDLGDRSPLKVKIVDEDDEEEQDSRQETE